jgi:magnesium and cobalt exporter, CNNM family
MSSGLSLFLLIFACLLVQGFFAMMEIACVSFNKVRLNYYISKKNRRAEWVHFLVQRPALLFGTTLIGVNAALFVGSEAARRFYESLGVSPDIAPITQVVLVLIFAEIAPMLAGRRYAEHVALLGIPLLFGCSMILRPFTWAVDFLCRGVTRLVGHPVQRGSYLSREELQAMLADRQEEVGPSREFSTIVDNLLSLHGMLAKDLAQPLNEILCAPATLTVKDLRSFFEKQPFLPLFLNHSQNIISVAFPKDFLRMQDRERVRERARTPWFVAEHSGILAILRQFRRNNQTLAVVLNEKGLATGILTLDEIVNVIFGHGKEWCAVLTAIPHVQSVIVERTLPGNMLLSDFNSRFQAELFFPGVRTLEELVIKVLGHPPVKGEIVHLADFEFTVEEIPLIGSMLIYVRTKT